MHAGAQETGGKTPLKTSANTLKYHKQLNGEIIITALFLGKEETVTTPAKKNRQF
jgi:hypothetical protein